MRMNCSSVPIFFNINDNHNKFTISANYFMITINLFLSDRSSKKMKNKD